MNEVPPVMAEMHNNDAAAPEQLLAEIHVFVGSELLAKYAIEHGEYIIGRDASCPVVVDADVECAEQKHGGKRHTGTRRSERHPPPPKVPD